MAPSILIIDDDEDFGSALTSFLEEKDFNVQWHYSLGSAREFLRRQQLPDMILLDVMLKDGNGLIFMNELRKMDRTKHIPVIMMSAIRNKNPDRLAGLEFGADDYLNKPFDFRELVLRMNRILTSKQHSVSKSPPSPEPPNLLEENPSIEEGLVPIDLDDPEKALILRQMRLAFGSLILAPTDFVRHIPVDLKKRVGIFCIGVTALGWGIQIGIANGSFGGFFVGSIVCGAGLAGLAAFFSWVVEWVLGLKRQRIVFNDVFIPFMASFGPLVLSSWLGVVYVFGVEGKPFEFTLGPALIFPSQIASNTLGYLLRRLDIFELWSVALLAFFMLNLFKKKPRHVLLWVGGAWGLVMVMVGVVRRVFL